MKFLMILTLGFCLLFAAVPAVADQAADKAAIREAMDRMYAAWNRHDAKGLVAEMHETYETWTGDMKGPAARQKYWEERFAAQKSAKYTKREEIGIVFVTPDVAIWKARGEISGWVDENGKTMPPYRFLMGSVVVKKNGKWGEVAYFGTPIEE